MIAALWPRFSAIAFCLADSIVAARPPMSNTRYDSENAGVICARVSPPTAPTARVFDPVVSITTLDPFPPPPPPNADPVDAPARLTLPLSVG